MDRALDPLRIEGGPEIVSVTNPAGPPGIECQAHVDDVSRDVRGIVRAHDNDAAAFVIACFPDPGIHAARASTAKPVFGIAERGLLTALALGNKAGIIAIRGRSVPPPLPYVRARSERPRVGQRGVRTWETGG